jgi:molybdenum cofactor cytidylyltransferase
MKKNLPVIILAGGNSDRMNFPKMFLPFDIRKTFIEKIVKEYFDFNCNEIIIVLNKNFSDTPIIKKLVKSYDINLILNEHSELEKFYSLSLGISILRNQSFCIIQNVDNPFISSSLLNKMYNRRNLHSYVIPVYKEKAGHPVLIGKTIIERLKIEKNLNANLRDILHEYKRVSITGNNSKILANINSVEDYKKYYKLDPEILLEK